jgi:hypothetical protein
LGPPREFESTGRKGREKEYQGHRNGAHRFPMPPGRA